jgi:DNA modification methylase
VRKEVIGNHTIYLGDCLDIMPALGKFDAVLTDPPYGIDFGNAGGFSKSHGWSSLLEGLTWDVRRPEKKYFDMMREISEEQIIWGGNYFTDYLPPTMQWLVWDKMQRDFSLADCEFAWSSQKKAARVFDYPRSKALQDGKEHPTQKPLELMKWCLDFLPNAKTVIDPFMGSGTTGVACVKRGRSFTGIEKEEKYFDVSRRRIEKAMSEPDMFVELQKATAQEKML